MTNKPYVKKYDATGKLINPIDGSYINKAPNRHMRRKNLKSINKYIEFLKRKKTSNEQQSHRN